MIHWRINVFLCSPKSETLNAEVRSLLRSYWHLRLLVNIINPIYNLWPTMCGMASDDHCLIAFTSASSVGIKTNQQLWGSTEWHLPITHNAYAALRKLSLHSLSSVGSLLSSLQYSQLVEISLSNPWLPKFENYPWHLAIFLSTLAKSCSPQLFQSISIGGCDHTDDFPNPLTAAQIHDIIRLMERVTRDWVSVWLSQSASQNPSRIVFPRRPKVSQRFFIFPR